MRFAAVLIAGAVILAVPASAGETQGKPPVAAQGGEQPKLICKRMEEPGSRIPGKKVCMSAAEWEQLSRAAQQQVRNNSHMGSTNGK